MGEGTAPQVRFEGFDGKWEESGLEDVAGFSKGQGYSKADLREDGTPLFLYGRIYTKYELAVTNVDTYAHIRPGSVVSTGNEVLVPSSGETSEDIATAVALLQTGVLLGGDINVIKPNARVDPVFLALRIGTGQVKDSLAQRAQGKSVVHLRNSDLRALRFDLPAVEEQRKIRAVFLKIDALIEQHRRKHRQLQQTKVAIMQRMFPRGDADEPELRFEGFSGVWERRRLEAFDIKTGPFGSALHASDYVRDGTPIVTTEHFKTGRLPIEGSGVPQVSDADAIRLSAYRLREGDIVFSRVGSVDLNAYVTRYQVGWLFSGRVLRVRPDGSCNPAYLHYALETEPVRQSILSRAVGLTMPSINTRILGDTTVLVPSSAAEQQAIGAMFSRLDDLIGFERTYIGKLQQVKTALLQKMFS